MGDLYSTLLDVIFHEGLGQLPAVQSGFGDLITFILRIIGVLTGIAVPN